MRRRKSLAQGPRINFALAPDRERVEHLFAFYETLTAPLLPAASKSRKRSRKS